MSHRTSSGIEELSAPIGVFLNLTQQCNMSCVYCCVEAAYPSQERREQELGDEEMLDLVDQLIEARVFRYVLTGGDVFLRRELLFEILERLKTRGSATVLTNATLIRDEDASRLAALGPGVRIALSIDAPREEINALTRGSGFLARTLRGAHRLMKHGVTPGVNCVISRRNHHLLDELAEFLTLEGFKNLNLNQLHEVGCAESLRGLSLDGKERTAVQRQIAELTKGYAGRLSITLGDDTKWLKLDEDLDCLMNRSNVDTSAPAMLLSCSAGVEQCSITADGWVTPCNSMLSYRCGNVREARFLSIWSGSPQLKRMRSLRETPVSAIAECSGCEYSPVCHGGCRALAYTHSGGDLLGFDPTCPHSEKAGLHVLH